MGIRVLEVVTYDYLTGRWRNFKGLGVRPTCAEQTAASAACPAALLMATAVVTTDVHVHEMPNGFRVKVDLGKIQAKDTAISADNHMRPQRGNSGQAIRQNFSRQDRLEAMRDFYRGPGAQYTDAARDFFSQNPGL